ncbi:MAG: MarR family transcriptional regulator [Clostridiales bacterium]|jgi:DNA-binding MarR family transcriptional regulator|nr:MarR family transcriptional regulator [Clostridiales bacterium]
MTDLELMKLFRRLESQTRRGRFQWGISNTANRKSADEQHQRTMPGSDITRKDTQNMSGDQGGHDGKRASGESGARYAGEGSQPPFTPPYTPFGGMPHHGRGRIIALLSERGCSGHTQKELAELLGVRPQSLSEALMRLEEDGLVRRERNEEDKRELRIFLTEAGKRLSLEINRGREKRAAEFFSPLTNEEKETLGILLKKLADAHTGI